MYSNSSLPSDLSGARPSGILALSLQDDARGVTKGVPSNDGESAFSPGSELLRCAVSMSTPNVLSCCHIRSRAACARTASSNNNGDLSGSSS